MDQVAVIVPIYRVEAYLDACVRSLLTQTYANVRIVLVDDGSPDRCGEMCEAYAREDARVVALHRANGGLSAARNTGLDWVQAETDARWITFVDSDDTVHPDFVKALVDGATACGSEIAAVAFEKVSRPKRGGAPASPRFAAQTPEAFWCADQVRATVATCKLFARRLWDGVRFPEGRINEDEFTTYRVLFATPRIAVCEDGLYYYLQRADSIMGRKARVWEPRRLDLMEAYRQQRIYFRQKGFYAAERLMLTRQVIAYAVDYQAVRWRRGAGAYRALLRTWAEGSLRYARRRWKVQMTEVSKSYFVLWPWAVNHLTWPFVRTYDLLTSVGIRGWWRQVRGRLHG